MNLSRFLLHDNAHARTPGITIEHARGYELVSALFFGGRRRHVFTRLAALSGAHPGDAVLDVGCGTGYLTRIIAEAVTPRGTVLGIDASADVLAYARRVTRSPHCTFTEGIAENLDAPDDSYDVVVTNLMLHHLPESLRPKAISEMFRVLRPGGRLLAADYRPPASAWGGRLMGALAGPAMRHNPVHQLLPLVAQAGFDQLLSGDVRPWIHYVQAVKPGQG
jgi:ubiquinone/menaquinone biosynthesis C-methylase UbiE